MKMQTEILIIGGGGASGWQLQWLRLSLNADVMVGWKRMRQ